MVHVPLEGTGFVESLRSRPGMKEAASKAMWTQKWLVAMTLDSTTAALICLIVFAVRKEWSRGTVCSVDTTTFIHFISMLPLHFLLFSFDV